MTRHMGRRQQVLEALRTSTDARTVTDLARRLHVHGNTIRFHLDSLLADGLIEVAEDPQGERSVGRPAVKYQAIARVAPSQMRHTETLVKLFLGDLASYPDGAQRAQEIGQRWGQGQAGRTTVDTPPAGRHQDVHGLRTLLEDMGFESDEPTNTEILVKSCPFLDDAQLQELKEDSSAGARELPPVCAVHLGVMQGALGHWDADLAVTELEPFARVDRCRIALARQK